MFEMVLKLFAVFDGLDVFEQFCIISKHSNMTRCNCFWKVVDIETEYDWTEDGPLRHT
jgi:hypothetical protein